MATPTEVAPDGETGLKVMRTFQPQLIILDLMLPGMSGVDVIKEIRSERSFAKIPIIVFSNTYLTNLIQEAWRAGANKCLSKSSCTPKDVIEVVRNDHRRKRGDDAARARRADSRRRQARRCPLCPMTPNFKPTCARPSLKICRPRFIRCVPVCKVAHQGGK